MKLNAFTVYPNQKEAGEEFALHLLKKKIPILAAQPQMGKTGTLIYAVSVLLTHYEKSRKRFRILHLINQSDNSVRNQTLKDYEEAFSKGFAGHTGSALLDGEEGIIQIRHLAEYRRIELDPGTLYIVIVDEGHAALLCDGQFQRFCQRLRETRNLLGLCSATPTTLEIWRHQHQDRFVNVILSPGKKYYGIAEYIADKRIFHAERAKDPTDRKKLSHHWKENTLPTFAQEVKKNGPGFLIVRNTTKQETGKDVDENISGQIVARLKALKCKARVEFFHGARLSKLEARISGGPVERGVSEVIVIEGALRLGKRIEKKYIRHIVDREKIMKGTTIIQSLLGRCCGNDARGYSFVIETDARTKGGSGKAEIGLYLEYIHWLNTGKRLISADQGKDDPCEIIFHDTEEEAIQELAAFKDHPAFKESYLTSRTKVSSNNSENACQRILHERKVHAHTVLIHLDKPNKRYLSAWKEVQSRYPESKGKYVLALPRRLKENGGKTTLPALPSCWTNKFLTDPTENHGALLTRRSMSADDLGTA